jgi:3-(3-hydroxy-phenyl)propionate hydroxylase
MLLNFSLGSKVDIARWDDRVDEVVCSCEANWKLPDIGEITTPAAVLIRPDGYIACDVAPRA